MITVGATLFLYSFIGAELFQYFQFELRTQKLILLGTRIAGAICVTLGFIFHSKRGKKDD
jgi:hypothetical protein